MAKKILFLFCSLVLSNLSVFCQDISHYEQIVKTTNENTKKLVALDSILKYTFKTDPDNFIAYSIEYIKIAQDLDSIEAADKKAINLQSPLTNYKNDPRQAITIINGVLARKYKIKDSLLLGGLYLNRGNANTKIDLKKAIDDYNLAHTNFSSNDSLNIADTYAFRGQAYSQLGKFILAREDLTTAFNIYETLKEYDYMVYAQEGIINMFSMNGFYEKAKYERDALIEKMKNLKLNSFLSNEYYNQALDYKKMKDLALEHKFLLMAEKSFEEKTSSNSTFIGIHSRLIEYYCEQNQIVEAKKHLDLLDSMKYDFAGNPSAEMNYLEAKSVYLRTRGK